MILRKITVVIASLHYLFQFIKAIILFPFEIKAFGKSSGERYDIMDPLLHSHEFDVFNSIIDIFWPITTLAMLLFLLSFLFEKKPIYSQNNINVGSESDEKRVNNPNDQPSTGLNIISFLIPLVGLIIYLTEREKSPIKATSAGKAALWGVGVTIVLSIISFFVMFSIISSIN